MSRRKTAKATAKRQTTNAFSTIQKMEKDFLQAPLQLVAQLNKEIAALKQKENKLKTVINKLNSQLKHSAKRLQEAAKVKTSAGKKQLKAVKQAHTESVKTLNSLNKQLQDITKSLAQAITKQAKLTALRKYLTQFEKEWAKNLKQAKAKAKTKMTKAKKAKAKTKTKLNEPKITEEPVHHQTFETIENISHDEPAELTS